MRFFLTILGAFLLTLSLDCPVLGQTESPPPDIPFPDPTEPTRPVPLAPPIPTPAPGEDPLQRFPEAEDVDEQEPVPGADEVLFNVDRIEVIGNTVLDAEIKALVSPLEGQEA